MNKMKGSISKLSIWYTKRVRERIDQNILTEAKKDKNADASNSGNNFCIENCWQQKKIESSVPKNGQSTIIGK